MAQQHPTSRNYAQAAARAHGPSLRAWLGPWPRRMPVPAAPLQAADRQDVSALFRPVLGLGLTVILSLLALPNAHAQLIGTTAGTGTQDATAKTKPSSKFPLSGEVRMSPSMAAGTLTTNDYARRPGLDLILGYRVGLALPADFTLSVSQLITKNLVTNADSGAARPYDTVMGDIAVGMNWSLRHDDAQGKHVPVELPGGFRLGAGLSLTLPTSRSSRYQNKYTALSPSLSLSRPRLFSGHLSLAYSVGVVKNFNRTTNAGIESSDGTALARPTGPELLGTQVLTSSVNTSFAIRNLVSASASFDDHWSLSVMYLLLNNFKYYDAPCDQYTSIHATCGRGRSDTQVGIVSLGYDFDGHTSLSLNALTASPPFSADNKSYRFPLFDFRSTTDNYSSVSAEVQFAF